MDSFKLDKDNRLCLLSIIIIIASYAAERLIEMFSTPTKSFALILSAVFSALAVVVFIILLKSKNPFFGLLTSLIGYKMMPPSINMLTQESLYGEAAYYLACKASVILFVVLIIKFYFMQSEPRKIKILPILAIMLVVPFFSEIGADSLDFFLTKTGSMLGYYIANFICYIAASLIILGIAYKSNYESMQFTAYFESTALGVNALKRLGAITANVSQGNHISRSYYVWLVIYALLIACFWIAKQKKKKEFNS
ncbi:MAG: hypothetical protein ACLUFN_04530 [Eubacterium sp.]